MMLNIKTKRKPLMLSVWVRTTAPQKIMLKVRNMKKPFTYYTNRWNTVNGDAVFYIRMPQTPAYSTLIVYNEKNGNQPTGADGTFKIVKIKRCRLPRQFTCLEADTKLVRNFIKFAQEFSEDAGILSANKSVYESDDGQFVINYLDVIRNKNGKKVRTPARINQRRGIIQLSKYHFRRYTVPMRMAILLHEFAHFYLNRQPSNEVEADLQALIIYLGLGYPKIEAHEAFLKVFKKSPSDGNKRRYEILSEFIENFEKFKFKKCKIAA